jgi:DNA-binding LacI/PurR family transcriptional regulator
LSRLSGPKDRDEMPANMQDVADRAGVSITTVSFVLNNTKNVRPHTRARIEQAIADLGFRRNLVARALASRRTRIIALVITTLGYGIRGAQPDFVVGAAREASAADHHLVVYPDDKDGSQLTALAGQGLVDGVILMEVQMKDPRVELLTGLDVPFALIGRTADTTGMYCVDIDFDTSMELAVEHLVGLGHRRIVYMPTGDPGDEMLGRYVRTEAAYRRLAKRHRIPPVVMPCRSSVPDGRDAAARLALEAPESTAVVAGNEAVAAGLVAGLQVRGVTIPAEVSVLSLLTSLEYRSASNPPLTVVSPPSADLGELGVRALLRRLEGDPPTDPELRAGVLVPGESTGQAPPRTPARRRAALSTRS